MSSKKYNSVESAIKTPQPALAVNAKLVSLRDNLVNQQASLMNQLASLKDDTVRANKLSPADEFAKLREALNGPSVLNEISLQQKINMEN